MFTGLIQGQGEIVRVAKDGAECRFTIRPCFALTDVVDGESIAVNGACLSVEWHNSDDFTVYASAATLSKTTLGSLVVGARVNLERALQVGSRLGGHIVSGHVDCIAQVASLEAAGESVRCTLCFPETFAPEVIPKGSVTLDGISLTINECSFTTLTVNIIPDTQARTTMQAWKVGSRVNMETDVLGKYVRRQLQCCGHVTQETTPESQGVTYDLLLQNGFL